MRQRGLPCQPALDALPRVQSRLWDSIARRRIAVMEAEAATADAWAGLTPRESKARRGAKRRLAADLGLELGEDTDDEE